MVEFINLNYLLYVMLLMVSVSEVLTFKGMSCKLQTISTVM